MRTSRQTATTTVDFLPREPLVWVFLCVASGVAADRLLGVELTYLLGTSVGLLASWLVSWLVRWRYSAVCLLLAVAGTSAAWHHAYFSVFSVGDVGFRVGHAPQPICVRGVVLTTPHFVAGKPDPLSTLPPRNVTSFSFRVTELRDENSWCPAAGTCHLWLADRLPTLTVGDHLQVFGSAH